MGNEISTKTQPNFDPMKYMGKWYEIAKYPIVWEYDCYAAEANYTWDPNNQVIMVENICLDKNLKGKRARYGRARIVNDQDKSKLMLKFTDGLPAGPESPYYVYWTDYIGYSIVGGSPEYLWILSRTPRIPKEDVKMLLERVRSIGYDPDRLMSNITVLK